MIVTLLKRVGIDRAVGNTLLANGWPALAGPLTLLLLTRFLSPNELGFYYTSSSVLAGMILFELGLSSVLLQISSHEWAHLEWTPQGLLGGNARAKSRLASLLRTSLLWYTVAAVLMGLIVLPGGFFYFRLHFPPSTHVGWQFPWIWTALVTVAAMVLTPIWAILQGCGLVAQVSALRFRQAVLGSLGQWTMLGLGVGLYAAPVYGTLTLFYACGWVLRHKREFMREMTARSAPGQDAMDWRQEVWPLQWKIALSGLSSYIIFQTFYPALLAARGPAAVGQLGLSMGVMQAVAGVAMTWLVTKCSPFGVLIAQREWGRLDREFFSTLWLSTGVVVLGVLSVWGLAVGLRLLGYPLGQRLLEPLPLGLLAAATVINHLVGAEALYLRVHKQEPFLVLSLTVAVLIGLSNLLLAAPLGVTGLMLGYFLVYLVVGLGGGTWIFVQKRHQWHQPVPVSKPQHADL